MSISFDNFSSFLKKNSNCRIKGLICQLLTIDGDMEKNLSWDIKQILEGDAKTLIKILQSIK
jgi:hypothetical protein